MTIGNVAVPVWSIAVLVGFLLIAGHRLFLRLFGVVMVPEDSIGIVNKKYVLMGANKSLPDGALIALHGQAGLQADPLAPGVHFGFWPWQYVVRLQKFITVPERRIGIVEARDGKPLSGGRVLARAVECDAFQDARKFLENGGERGPQLAVIPPGTYRINTALFSVVEEKALEIEDNTVGVVTTREGAPLRTGDIAGPEVPGHNLYQNAQLFLDNGGRKGLQEQVILAGRYFINPRFATIEIKPMTSVPIATAGVVISYVGETGKDVTGDAFKHGNLFDRGQKGVWVEPLDPGMYPINPYTHKVENVPTANVVLNWATGKTESHKLDEKLSTIKVRSSDGFTFNLDVSQIIHVPRSEAPKVIARFGNMANLVTQVLEPTIGNYFRNAAQESDVIDFLRGRQERQVDAKKKISGALAEYNVVAVDTLIGDITPPEDLMKTLTDRKLAEQQKKTFDTQRLAEDTRKELQQARALAETQPQVVTAQRNVEIAEFDARSTVKKAAGSAEAAVVVAKAAAEAAVLTATGEAQRLKLVGDAEASMKRAIGTAEADVIKQKIASMDAGNYAGIEIARALSTSGQKLVPDVIAGGNGGGSNGTLVDVLLAGIVKDQLNGKVVWKPNEKPIKP